MLHVAGQLSDEMGLPFVEAVPGARVEGVFRKPLDLVRGRLTVIERSRDFMLVPWRRVLEAQIGKQVAGFVRGDGVD